MTINSREKGKRVEREAAKKLNETIGGDWIRSQQHAGSPDAPDIKSPDYPNLIIEVKGDERLNVFKAMEQAEGYCTEHSIPVVMHKKNNKPFLLTIKADDLVRFRRSLNQVVYDEAMARAAAVGDAPDGYDEQRREKYGDE